jgi:hypothetical protein
MPIYSTDFDSSRGYIPRGGGAGYGGYKPPYTPTAPTPRAYSPTPPAYLPPPVNRSPAYSPPASYTPAIPKPPPPPTVSQPLPTVKPPSVPQLPQVPQAPQAPQGGSSSASPAYSVPKIGSTTPQFPIRSMYLPNQPRPPSIAPGTGPYGPVLGPTLTRR